MSRQRFKSYRLIIPLEFDSVFKWEFRVRPRKVLAMLSRENLVKLAMLLCKEYCGKPAIKTVQMLSSTDKHTLLLANRIKHHVVELKQQNNTDVIVAFVNTPLELLRIAFSIDPDKMRDAKVSRIDDLQWKLVKLITQINQNLMHFKAPRKDKGDFAKLLLVNDASNRDILKQDIKGQFVSQPIQAVLFFQLLESKQKYTKLLNAFYERYGISSWKEYVRSVYGLALFSLKEGTGVYPRKKIEETPELVSLSVLDKISIDANNEVIKYACDNVCDNQGNSDYKVFKSRPLIKLSSGDFVIHNPAIVIDRLYSSLYFDFKDIREDIAGKQPDVNNLFTSEFIEKTLFSEVVSKCINHRYCKSYREEDLIQIHKITDGELGYPDCFVRQNTDEAVVLFECKDIRLNAWIKERRDYGLLEKELKNKIVTKTYKIDKKSKKQIKISPKRIGIGQLAGHVANIRNGSFPWALDLPDDIVIYPILVIADNRLVFDGLPRLAQKWYYECLASEGLQKLQLERQLIMMSPLTFIKYQ